MPQNEPLLRLREETHLSNLVDHVVAFLLAQPLARFLSARRVLGHLDATCDSPILDRALRRHVAAFASRDRDRAKARGDRLADYLTPETLALLRRELGAPVVLDRAFLETLVKQDPVRHLLRAVVEETLQRFVQALKPGGKNGLFGGLPKGPGLGIITRMAEQIEAQVQRAATVFVSQSLEALLGRLVHILTTPETAQQLGRLRLAGFDAFVELRTRTLWNLVHRLPIGEFLEHAPGLLRHNLSREGVRQALREEVEAIVADEGAQTLGDLLGDEAEAAWRETSRELLGPLLREFVLSDRFQAWLAEPGSLSESGSSADPQSRFEPGAEPDSE